MNKIEKQQSNIETLFGLIKENPELDIVPMVDNDVCQGDDFAYWMGEWGSAKVDEVYYSDERIYFRSSDEEELIDKQCDYIFDNEYPSSEFLNDEESKGVGEKAKEYVNDLPWEKVIVVNINLP